MIKPLTSLRFFFALMVFFRHLGNFKTTQQSLFNQVYDVFFTEGYIGVGFFFTLSGFILAHVYKLKIENCSISKIEFWTNRIARIYPLHILTLIIAIPLTYESLYKNSMNWILLFISNISLTQSFIPKSSFIFSFNSVSWSISDEMFFYLAFPFLIIFFKRISLNYKILAFILLTTGLIISMFLCPQSLGHKVFYINPVIRLADFILGILVFEIALRMKESNFNGTLVEALSLLVFAAFYFSSSLIPQVFRFSVFYWVPVTLLILVFYHQKGWFSKILSNKTLVLLGEISFGFYMFHQVVIRYITHLNENFNFLSNDILIIFCAFFITLIISYLSFLYFEQPMNKIVKHFAQHIKIIRKHE